MKTLVSVLFLMTVTLAAYSQTEKAAEVGGDNLSENLLVRLVIEEHGVTIADIELLVSPQDSQFAIDHIIHQEGEEVQPLGFTGNLRRTNEGEFLLDYMISQRIAVPSESNGDRQSLTYMNTGWESAALLSLGEEVTLMKEPTREHRLSLIKASERRENKPDAGNSE